MGITGPGIGVKGGFGITGPGIGCGVGITGPGIGGAIGGMGIMGPGIGCGVGITGPGIGGAIGGMGITGPGMGCGVGITGPGIGTKGVGITGPGMLPPFTTASCTARLRARGSIFTVPVTAGGRVSVEGAGGCSAGGGLSNISLSFRRFISIPRPTSTTSKSDSSRRLIVMGSENETRMDQRRFCRSGN
jgi:hypothetical protein